jgi:hypothetical protein
MPTINSFRDLLVWRKSVDLAVNCHHIAKRFPRDEQPALGHQVRKSSLSIPSNVAETRIGIVSEVEADTLIRDAAEIGRMLNGLVKSLERGR